MVSHMPTCAHARRTHAHARPRDGAFDGHRTRAMDTKNIKQKSALFGGARGATKAPGPRTGEPWTRARPVSDRQRPWRRQSSTLLSSSSSSFEPHAHAMSTSAMMQAVGETMHAYTHDDHAMRRVVVVARGTGGCDRAVPARLSIDVSADDGGARGPRREGCADVARTDGVRWVVNIFVSSRTDLARCRSRSRTDCSPVRPRARRPEVRR